MKTTQTPNMSCQTCGQGSLNKKKKYRMSMPVVIIGYLILVPCVIGMLFGVLGLFGTGSASSVIFEEIDKETKTELTEASVPTPLIQKVLEDEVITEDDKEGLSDEQREALDLAKMGRSAGQVGAGAGTAIAGGLSIAMVIFSFMGGLLGWLLIMKKKVLQCNSCSAVVAAS